MFVVTTFDLYSFIPDKSQYKLAESAARIATHNFGWATTLLLFNSTIVTGVEIFLELYKNAVLIGNGKFYSPFAQKTRQYILFGTDVLNIHQMLDYMRLHRFDNTGKYIVTCQSQDCNENEAVDIFWNHKITNVVFIKLTPKQEIVGYSYYHPEDCLHSKPAKTKICTNDDASCYGMFPEKVINLRRCEITVSTFPQIPYMNITTGVPKGADGDILRLIVERLNATLKLMTPRIGEGWGKLERNGTWTGSLRDLLDDYANFSMSSPALTLTRIETFQMSMAYSTINIVWVTHPTEVKPASLKLFYPFTTYSQIALAVSFIFVCVCAWFFNSQYWPFRANKKRISKSKVSVLFYSWMICMGLPSTKLPTKPVFMSMALIWIWYCFLVRTLYQVYLISSLQGIFYYDELNSIEEAYHKNISFGGGLPLRDYYVHYPLIYDSWKPVNTSNIVSVLGNLSEFVLAINVETAKSIIKKHKYVVRYLPQSVVNSPTVIFYKKFSPLAKSIDIILFRLVEGGFTDKIFKKYASTNEPVKDVQIPITLEHYTGCYLILVIGWLISIVMFLYELYYCKLHKFRCIAL